ncbi:hypothetical protein EV424DRAFT_1561736 [Suillus variegatus]|nr:hypothetical protein EV424DRAFT_1561736 [Suillus variegatus]
MYEFKLRQLTDKPDAQLMKEALTVDFNGRQAENDGVQLDHLEMLVQKINNANDLKKTRDMATPARPPPIIQHKRHPQNSNPVDNRNRTTKQPSCSTRLPRLRPSHAIPPKPAHKACGWSVLRMYSEESEIRVHRKPAKHAPPNLSLSPGGGKGGAVLVLTQCVDDIGLDRTCPPFSVDGEAEKDEGLQENIVRCAETQSCGAHERDWIDE